jgi:magnesium transporter
VEDVREFHQRPKIEDYDDFVSIVVYGARALGEPLTEVHCFYAERFLVSVHRDEVPAVADACHILGRLHTDRRLVALYRLLDALVDTMFPYLTAMDERIDELQDQIFVDPKESQLAGLFELKRELVTMRKMVTPQRDMVDSYRDLLSGSLDAYMSMVSNRLAGEPGRVADGVPRLRHRHRGAGRHRPVHHVPAARLDGQEELTRRTGSAPGRAREKAPG